MTSSIACLSSLAALLINISIGPFSEIIFDITSWRSLIFNKSHLIKFGTANFLFLHIFSKLPSQFMSNNWIVNKLEIVL